MAASKITNDELTAELESGLSLSDIAAKYGMSKASLSERAKKLGFDLSVRASKKKVDVSLLKHYIEVEKRTINEIAQLFGCSNELLHKLIPKHGIQKPEIISDIITDEELTDLVVNQQLSFVKIGRMIADRRGETMDRTAYVSIRASKLGIKSAHADEAVKIELDCDSIAQQYNDGKSVTSLKNQYKVSHQTIWRAIKEASINVQIRDYYQSIALTHFTTPDDLRDLSALKQFSDNKMTVGAIARQLGVSKTSVIRAYRTTGVERFFQEIANPLPVSEEEVARLYVIDGLSLLSLAAKFKTNRVRIRSILTNQGVKLRNSATAPLEEKYPQLINYEWMYNKYVVEEASAAEISREVGCNVGNVLTMLDRLGIQLRDIAAVYTLREDHGVKMKIRHGDQLIKTDSLLEVDFVRSNDFGGLQRFSGSLEAGGTHCIPDFVDETAKLIVEVKPIERATVPGFRRDLIKQKLVAEANGYTFKCWAKGFVNVEVMDDDIYYSKDWRLHFDSADTCAEWLLKFGFRGYKSENMGLYSAIKKYSKLLEKHGNSDKLLDSRWGCSQLIEFIRHFSPHFYYSKRGSVNCSPIADLFTDAGSETLHKILVGMWSGEIAVRNINLISLLNYTHRNIDRFRMISIFKPWVARYVYQKLLPNGGVVVDPCVGWGGRLLGCMGQKLYYHGFDFNPNVITSVSDMGQFVKKVIQGYSIRRADAADYKYPEADLLFTSPPYDNIEMYHGINYSTPTKTSVLVDNMLDQSYKIVALNVPKNMREDTIWSAVKHGYTHTDTFNMITNSLITSRPTSEPILVFRK